MGGEWQGGSLSGHILPGDLVDDRDLRPEDKDLFSHGVIVSRVAEILRVSKGPLNVGVFGAWGTGKTSFLNRLEGELVQRPSLLSTRKFRVVRYDAWRYGSAALRRDLIAVASRQLGVRGPQFSSGLFEGRQTVRVEANDVLQRARLFTVGMFKVLVMLGILGAIAAGAWLLLRQVPGPDLPSVTLDDIRDRLPTAFAWATAIAAAANVPTLLGVSVNRSKPSEDDEFSQTLRDLVALAEVPYFCRFFVAVPLLGKVARLFWRRRIVFLIDELDRSSDAEIVTTLNALQTLLSTAGVYVVLAADRAVVGNALEVSRHQAGPSREFDPYRSGYESYFDKLFQVQFSLPPLRNERVATFADDLVRRRLGVWSHVRRAGLLDDVIYVLIPGHIDSPRRVKVLLNAFASSCRVASGRGLDAVDLFLDIAQWVVFQNEFPTFAEDCLIEPRLKSSMLSGETPSSPTAKRIRERHDRTDDPPATNESSAWVDWNRRQLLWQYLEQVSHLGDPPRALLYLEEAGSAVGHFETEIATALDSAGDTSPQRTLESLGAMSQADRLNASSFIARRARVARSIARDRLISVLAALIMTIERGKLEPIAAFAPALRPVDVDRALLPAVWFAAIRTAVLTDDLERAVQLTGRTREEPDITAQFALLEYIEADSESSESIGELATWLVQFLDSALIERLGVINPNLCYAVLAKASGHVLICEELENEASSSLVCSSVIASSPRTRREIVDHLVDAVVETTDGIPTVVEKLVASAEMPPELRSDLACAVVSEYDPDATVLEFAPMIDRPPQHRVSASKVVSQLWTGSKEPDLVEVSTQALARLCQADSKLNERLASVVDAEGWDASDEASNLRRVDAIESLGRALGKDLVNLASVGNENAAEIVDLVVAGALRGTSLAAMRTFMGNGVLADLDSRLRSAARGQSPAGKMRVMEARLEIRAGLPNKMLARVSNPEVARVARLASIAKDFDVLQRIAGLHFSTARSDHDLIAYLRIVHSVAGIPLAAWSSKHSRQSVERVWLYLASAGYQPGVIQRLADHCLFDSSEIQAFLVDTAKGAEWRRADAVLRTAPLSRPDVTSTAYAVVAALASNSEVDARKAGVRLASDLDQSKLPDWLKGALEILPPSYFRRAAERGLARVLGVGGKRKHD